MSILKKVIKRKTGDVLVPGGFYGSEGAGDVFTRYFQKNVAVRTPGRHIHHKGLLLLVFVITACASRTTTPIPADSAPTSVLATNIWNELLLATPYPHTFPLPEATFSALDGTFAKLDESPPQFWTFYRCADYRPTGGIWRIQFDQGVRRIVYQITNWTSIASFTVEGDRVKLFNDPLCPQDVGEYQWSVENGELDFTVVEDGCAFNLRKENLTKQSWKSCGSDNEVTGCTDSTIPPNEIPANLPVTVTIVPGDSHYFDIRPEVFVAANDQNVASPEGIQLRYHENSIPYGTHRVLWWKGDWLEATTELPYTSIGVQFWGSGYLGSARVLFDGVEVWRGSTVSLGKSLWRALEWMGMQRHLKVLGIFCRLEHRDGKPHYSSDLPRFFGYVARVAVRYRELKPLIGLIEPMAGPLTATGYTLR